MVGQKFGQKLFSYLKIRNMFCYKIQFLTEGNEHQEKALEREKILRWDPEERKLLGNIDENILH